MFQPDRTRTMRILRRKMFFFWQILRRLLDQMNSTNTTTEQRLSILLELEYLVHQVTTSTTAERSFSYVFLACSFGRKLSFLCISSFKGLIDEKTQLILVFQVDNAQTLCSMGGLPLILDGLNSSDFRLQESSAFVLGSALSRYVHRSELCRCLLLQN